MLDNENLLRPCFGVIIFAAKTPPPMRDQEILLGRLGGVKLKRNTADPLIEHPQGCA
jgi:hypothetical protein